MLLVPGVHSIHGNVAQSILGGQNAIIITDRKKKMPPGRLKIYNETSGEWEYVAPGIQGATGPQGATGVQGSTGPAYTISVSSTTSASSLTPNATNFDMYAYTALAADLTINAPSGAADGKRLMFRVKDNGTSRTLTWNAIYASAGPGLPTSTTAGKTTYVGLIYNSASSKWDCIAVSTEA